MPQRAFTLVELLIVIAVLATLMALAVPVTSMALNAADQLKCENNLGQLGKMIITQSFRQRSSTRSSPDTLNGMLSTNGENREVCVCPIDPSQGTAGDVGREALGLDTYYEIHELEIEANDHLTDVRLSYLYEISGAVFNSSPRNSQGQGYARYDGWPWDAYAAHPDGEAAAKALFDEDNSSGGGITWKELKRVQKKFWARGKDGQRGHPVGDSKFPIIRCFHHAEPDTPASDKPILNVAWDGHVFDSQHEWEKDFEDLQ